MILNKLQLSNFRRFQRFKLDFKSTISVIIGQNGAGKTTILDALAISLTHLTGELLSENEGYNIDAWFTKNDINNQVEEGSIEVIINLPEMNDGKDFSIQVKKAKNQKGLTFDKKPDNVIRQFKGKIRKNEVSAIPVIAYYGVDRALESKEEVKSVTTYNPLLFAYEKSLTIGSSQFFKAFERWYINEIIKENAYKIQHKNFDATLPGLNYIRKCLNTFFAEIEPEIYGNLVLLNDVATLPDFNQESNNELGIEKNGSLLAINQLSHGERSIIGVIADIARRSFIANPKQESETMGLVLIDEIELHLHPKWQKSFVNAFKKVFPNLALVATTHSPMVLSGLQRDSIIVLNDGQIVASDDLPDLYTATADEILEKLMWTGNNFNPFSKQIEELDKLFNNLEFDEAFEKLNEIKKNIKSKPEWLKKYEQRIAFARS